MEAFSPTPHRHIHRRSSVKWVLSENVSPVSPSNRLYFFLSYSSQYHIKHNQLNHIFNLFHVCRRQRPKATSSISGANASELSIFRSKQPFPSHHDFSFPRKSRSWTHGFPSVNRLCPCWCYWIPKRLNTSINIPMKKGSVLAMHRKLAHSSAENRVSKEPGDNSVEDV